MLLLKYDQLKTLLKRIDEGGWVTKLASSTIYSSYPPTWGRFSVSSAVDGFRPIIIANGFDSSQLRQIAHLYFLHAENFASVFKLHSIHDSAYFLEELSNCEELVGVTHRR